MALGEPLQRKLGKHYEASSLIYGTYKGNDIAFKTDEEGNPIVLFIGTKDSTGKIKGQRYTRTLKKNAAGETIKDHWDLKGKA